MFEKASRLKLRFNTSKGLLSVEDLWDLPLTSNTGKANLDDVARDLHRKLKDDNAMSFVDDKSADKESELAFEIVKHVIKIRLEERDAQTVARANSEKKQQILALIASKENEQLAGQSLDDLKALANSL